MLLYKFFLVLVLALAVFALPTAAQSPVQDTRFWLTDAEVFTSARMGNRLFIGGPFTYVGPPTRSFVGVDTLQGERQIPWPEVEGSLFAIEPDGIGGFYVGGSFSKIGGVAKQNMAHLFADLRVDPDFTFTMAGAAYCLKKWGNTLYIGGTFTSINGSNRGKAAAISLLNNTLTSWSPNMDRSVYTVEAYKGKVYMGGNFLTVGVASRRGFVVLDSTNAANVGSLGVRLSTVTSLNFPEVFCIKRVGERFFVGGNFVSPRRNAFSFSSLTNVHAWNPNPSGQVHQMVIQGDRLYLGGVFDSLQRQYRPSIAVIDTLGAGTVGTFSVPITNTLLVSHKLNTLQIVGNKLYIGGLFRTVGGEERRNAACIRLDNGAVTPWAVHTNDAVQALQPYGNRMMIAGIFSSANGFLRTYGACLNTLTGAATDWDPKFNRAPLTFAAGDGELIAGGTFTQIGGIPKPYLALLDTATGSPKAFTSRLDARVRKVYRSGSRLYIGGGFTRYGGRLRNRLAAFAYPSMDTLSWNPNANGEVNTLSSVAGRVFVGGGFGTVSNASRICFAEIDSVTGRPTSRFNGASQGFDRAVYGVEALSTGQLFAVGAFANYQNSPLARIANINLATTSANTWATATDTVSAIVFSGNFAYCAGAANRYGGQTRSWLVQINLTTGIPTAFNPLLDDRTHHIAVHDDLLVVGGQFQRIGAVPQMGLAVYTLPALPAIDITNFSPRTANPGSTITLTGNNLLQTRRVTFGGQDAASFTLGTNTQLTAVVGAGGAGAVAVYSAIAKDSLAGFSLCTLTPATLTPSDTVPVCQGATAVVNVLPADGATVTYGAMARLPKAP